MNLLLDKARIKALHANRLSTVVPPVLTCVLACSSGAPMAVSPAPEAQPAQSDPVPAPSPAAALMGVSETPGPKEPAAPGVAAAPTYYAGYRGAQPIELWLAPAPGGAFEGVLSGLSAQHEKVHAAYRALLSDEEWPANGMVQYSGEFTGSSLSTALRFELWRGPSDDIEKAPNELPGQIVAVSGPKDFWLSKVGDEKRFALHQKVAQKLAQASGRRPSGCGLRFHLKQVVEERGAVRAAAYYLADLCAPSSPEHPGNERFFVAAFDASGEVSSAIALGEMTWGTFDEETPQVLAVDFAGQSFFAVRRDWAKRAGGRAAATADGWLLGTDENRRLRITMSLGHWDINSPDGPGNCVADVSVAEADEPAPEKLIIDSCGAISTYTAAKAAGNLRRFATKSADNERAPAKKRDLRWAF